MYGKYQDLVDLMQIQVYYANTAENKTLEKCQSIYKFAEAIALVQPMHNGEKPWMQISTLKTWHSYGHRGL